MRIVIATPHLPWPPTAGGHAAQYATLKCLATDHTFVLVSPIYRTNDLQNAARLNELLPGVTVRGVHCGAEGTRLRKAGKRTVDFFRRMADRIQDNGTSSAQQLFYNPFSPLPRPLVEAINEEIMRGCDLFQAEFAEMLQLAPWVPRAIPRLFIHHQLHSVYTRRAAEVGSTGTYSRYLELAMHAQEIAFLREFDGVVTFSETDRLELVPFLSPERVFTSPFPAPADVPFVSAVTGDWDGRFVFLASEIHPPNRDGLEWLFSEIWPHIVARLPSSSLQIVGRWSARYASRYRSRSVKFLGFVDDLQKVLRNAILLVPLRVGSGIRVKILAAMASGIPVVSTTIGCEGLPVVDGANIMIADSPGEFAAAATSLAADPHLWRRVASDGLHMVREHYAPEAVRRTRNEVYKRVMDDFGTP